MPGKTLVEGTRTDRHHEPVNQSYQRLDTVLISPTVDEAHRNKTSTELNGTQITLTHPQNMYTYRHRMMR